MNGFSFSSFIHTTHSFSNVVFIILSQHSSFLLYLFQCDTLHSQCICCLLFPSLQPPTPFTIDSFPTSASATSTAPFCTHTLTDPHITALLRDRFVLYCADISSDGGWRVSQSFGAVAFPFLAILSPSAPGTNPTVLAGYNGCPDDPHALERELLGGT